MDALAKHAKRYPDLAPLAVDESGLSTRDAALAHAILDQTIRRWITLTFLLELRLKRPLQQHAPSVQAALLAGAAQLTVFDRLPAYAVIDETVEWVKSRHGRKSSGLVNAVLRRVMEMMAPQDDASRRRENWTNARDELPLPNAGAVALREPILPEHPVERLAIATGLPPAMLTHLSRDKTFDEVRQFALHGLQRPPAILNASHATAPLPESCKSKHDMPGHVVFQGPHAELASLLQGRSDIWAQDPTSSAACLLASGLSPKVAIDMCAGQGTKTRQLRALFPHAQIVATDTNAERMKTLKGVFQRDDRVQTIEFRSLNNWIGKADLVLIDAPCSNSGVLARRPEARHRWSTATIDSLVSVQRQILADSQRLLAPGARILYATCSVDRRENDMQAEWLVKWHHMRIARSESRWPAGGPGQPDALSHDGGFAALLES